MLLATGSHKACNLLGFNFELIRLPEVTEVVGTSGPHTGGTAVEIIFNSDLPSQSLSIVYCRIGTSSGAYAGQMINEHTVLCFTRDAPQGPSIAEIEISVNGLDFFFIGHQFEYTKLDVLDTPIAFPTIEPVIFYTNPSHTPAGVSHSIRVYGENFMGGATCFIGHTIALSTEVVSDKELKCLMPVHIPGPEYLTVHNPGGSVSTITEITFVLPAAVRQENVKRICRYFSLYMIRG